MTVLANEQVIDGRGWRSGAMVERRKLAQWFLKITDFADDLLDGLKGLVDGPERLRLMQENWIGRRRGPQFRFRTPQPVGGIDAVERVTTRPDTIFGPRFVAGPAPQQSTQPAAAPAPRARVKPAGPCAVRGRRAAEGAAELATPGAVGVYLGFGPMPAEVRADFTLFVQELRSVLDAAKPGLQITFDITAS